VRLVSAEAAVTVNPARRVRGRVRVPGDKSVSHRYALLAALAEGPSSIRGFAPGADCRATLACLTGLGVRIDRELDEDRIVVSVEGARGRLTTPADPLDASNSGTTMRLLAGVLAGQPGLEAHLRGDASLSRRPMRRVIDPLTRMGAVITSQNGRPPLQIRGAALTAIDFTPEVPSAQVKSAVLLAGLFATGTTRVHERDLTRDHTERAFAEFGIRLDMDRSSLAVEGGQRFEGRNLDVPGDICRPPSGQWRPRRDPAPRSPSKMWASIPPEQQCSTCSGAGAPRSRSSRPRPLAASRAEQSMSATAAKAI
jgi:3-phosphoshikimate 1-carboxyvinyltransferase